MSSGNRGFRQHVHTKKKLTRKKSHCCSCQVPCELTGPKIVRRLGDDFHAMNPAHGGYLNIHQAPNLNMAVILQCEYNTAGTDVAACPCNVSLGFNYADLNNKKETLFPVVFFGHVKRETGQTRNYVSLRTITGCVHPPSARTPLAGRYAFCL